MPSNRNYWILGTTMPLALSASMAFAQAGTNKFASATIDELKQVYLACDRTASRRVLDRESAAHCSSVGDALQMRAFDGNFDRLLAWWRAAKGASPSAQSLDEAMARERP